MAGSRLLVRSDFRAPELRKEVFARFFQFHLRYRSHPGGVYYLIPWLQQTEGWTYEEAMWFATINGATQNPVTSLLLHRRGSTPDRVDDLIVWWRKYYDKLAVDTDRRHQKRALPDVLTVYAERFGNEQWREWAIAASDGFAGVWKLARSIPTFGRLSAYSYAEFLRIVGLPSDCDGLMLDDRDGSRSHRNGLAIVLGRDDLDWHASNPTFDGCYSGETLEWMNAEAADILDDARDRARGTAYERDVSYFTLESALCTYKSWHRPNRRYPNVYNDMLYERIRQAEQRFPSEDLSTLWRARAAALPDHLRLETSPNDPGCIPIKQNWYRTTGQVIMMDRDWPEFVNDFNDAVDAGAFGTRDF